MRERLLARILVPIIVASAVVGIVRPSWACGCGALITSTRSGVDVADETSIVRYDGSEEEIGSSTDVQHEALVALLTDALSAAPGVDREQD